MRTVRSFFPILLVCAGITGAPRAQQLLGDVHTMFPPGVTDTGALALVDVDGDGDLDALVVGAAEGPNQLFRNDGNGVFRDEGGGLPPETDETLSVATGDVDGDGDVDVVIGNAAAQNRLFLGDGAGGFTDATAQLPADGVTTSALAFGDVDGDGDLDLLLANSGGTGERNRIYLNDGTGTFTNSPLLLPNAFDRSRCVALGDVDGDGDLDVFFGNVEPTLSVLTLGDQDHLYLNDGTGNFSDVTATQLPVAEEETTSAVFGDVDGDGDLDLFLGGDAGVFLLRNQNRLYLNDGAGGFTDATGQLPVDTDRTRQVALVDTDGDGDLDALNGNVGRDRIYRNDGAGVFTQAPPDLADEQDPTEAVAVGDVDGDGDADLLIGNGDQVQDLLLLNDGAGVFTNVTGPLPTPRVDSASTVVLADVDGDGDLDMYRGRTFSQDQLLLGDGTGGFVDATALLPADIDETSAVELGDVNGDGNLDVVAVNRDFIGSPRLYLGLGTGAFIDASGSLPTMLVLGRDIALFDMEGDGDLDIGLASTLDNKLVRNDGPGLFSIASPLPPIDSDPTYALLAGDVDGDGDPDLFSGNLDEQNRLELNDGTGTFVDATSQLPALLDTTLAAEMGDVDGDGDLDVMTSNALFLNDATGNFIDASAQLPPSAANSRSLELGDLDGDGDLDAVLGGEPVRFYRNDGAAVFTNEPGEVPAGAATIQGLALGDIDADGDLDVVTGSGPGGYDRFFRNLSTQLAWRGVARVGKPLDLDLFGASGEVWAVGQAFGTASLPLPFGTLLLDPLTLQVVGGGVLDASGLATLRLNVPPDPALVGFAVDFQAAFGPPVRLSNRDRTVISGL